VPLKSPTDDVRFRTGKVSKPPARRPETIPSRSEPPGKDPKPFRADREEISSPNAADEARHAEGKHAGNGQPIRYSRSVVNTTCADIRRIFKWAVSKELVPSTVLLALKTVPGIRPGQSEARDPAPVLPVADDIVDATMPFVCPVVADMVRFQRLTGCRPGEVRDLRPMDVDRGGKVWQDRPATHKTTHKGRERIIFIGPKAKAILRRRFGLEAAQTVLGHAQADVTQIYAERDHALAADVMEKIG
jgi:integrase